MMKFLRTYTATLVLLLLFISTEAFAQQNGTINGKVTTADRQDIAGVTVSLKHTKYNALTNTNGEYIISKARADSYQVVSSYIRREAQEQAAIVKTSEVTTVNFVLKESSLQLNTVIVSSSKNNRPTNAVAKIPLKNLENPQVYSSVSSDLIKEQGGNYAGVYKVIDNNVTGVFELPSYALMNASLSYDTKYFRVACHANNITNQTYYIGY